MATAPVDDEDLTPPPPPAMPRRAIEPSPALSSILSTAAVASSVQDSHGCLPSISLIRSRYRRRMDPIVNALPLDHESRRQIMALVIKPAAESSELAHRNHRYGSILNLIMLIGGILVSTLIVVQQQEEVRRSRSDSLVFWALMGLSVFVNIATGIQQMFNFFEVSRIHDETFTQIDTLAWSFFTLSGPFEGLSHPEAFRDFMDRVNHLRQAEADAVRSSRLKIQHETTRTASASTPSAPSASAPSASAVAAHDRHP